MSYSKGGRGGQTNTQDQQERSETPNLDFLKSTTKYLNKEAKEINLYRNRKSFFDKNLCERLKEFGYKKKKCVFFENLFKEQGVLFKEKKIESKHIADFLNNLRFFYNKKELEEFLNKKFGENFSNFLGFYCRQIVNQIDNFELEDLTKTLKGLAYFSNEQKDIKIKGILKAALGGNDKLQSKLLAPVCGRIKDRINDFEPKHIACILKCFRKICIIREDLNAVLGGDSNLQANFLKPVCERIGKQISSFKLKHIGSIFNGLVSLNITRQDLSAALGGDDKLQSELLAPVCKRIINQIGNFIEPTKRMSVILNSLTNLFLCDNETPEEIKGVVLSCIKVILNKVKELDEEEINSIVKATNKNFFYLKNILGLSIPFTKAKSNSPKETVEEDTKSNNSHNESPLEKKVRGFLENEKEVNKKSIKAEVPIIYNDDIIGEYTHPIDFTCKYKGKTVYLETDGSTTHFVNSNQKEEDKNPKTKIRDQINEFIISKMDGDCIYVTVPANKCESKEIFFSYLDEKLGIELTPAPEEYQNQISKDTNPINDSTNTPKIEEISDNLNKEILDLDPKNDTDNTDNNTPKIELGANFNFVPLSKNQTTDLNNQTSVPEIQSAKKIKNAGDDLDKKMSSTIGIEIPKNTNNKNKNISIQRNLNSSQYPRPPQNQTTNNTNKKPEIKIETRKKDSDKNKNLFDIKSPQIQTNTNLPNNQNNITKIQSVKIIKNVKGDLSKELKIIKGSNNKSMDKE